MKKVLIPIDWSENAEKAFDWYVYHLHRRGIAVVIVHFIEASSDKELLKKTSELAELQEVYESRMLQMKIDFNWITGNGSNPGDFIVKTAREENVDMIVMGARGRGFLAKKILGSVSDYIISKAKIPVCVYGT